MKTLAQLENEFSVEILDHLDRQAEIPTVTKLAAQGDILLRRVDGPAATTPMPKAGVVVVRGETGHTHSLHGVGFWDVVKGGSEGSLALGTLTVPEESEVFLLHPEHGGMHFTPGNYALSGQREFSGEWRRVAD